MATIKTSIKEGKLIFAVNGQPEIVVNPDDFAADIRQQAMLHGFKQKIGDAAALSRGTDGHSATAQEKYQSMVDVQRQLIEGDWNRRGAGDGSGSLPLLVLALVRLTGKSEEDISAVVKTWDKATQDAMRLNDPQVAPVIQAIKAERAAKIAERGPKVDTKALLASFMTKVADQAPEPTPEPASEPTPPTPEPVNPEPVNPEPTQGKGNKRK